VIPVYINAFNRLTTTRNLVSQVSRFADAVPIIIDNASDYEPLLEWYQSNPCEVIRLPDNIGHHAPWLSGVIEQDQSPLYVVTDCDLDLAGVPVDVLDVLQEPFHWSSNRPIKSGLALRIDDLPPWQQAVRNWELRWWRHRSKDKRFYIAPIDTTFALYESTTPHHRCMDVMKSKAVRLAGSYQARHVPWYLDCENLDTENQNYFLTANSSNSWKPTGKALTTNHLREHHRAPRRI
jgi:hypothetical protein